MEDETRLWTFIPVSDFDIPSPRASEVARGGSLHLWKLLQRVFRQPKNKAASEEPQWDCPPVDLLRSISPEPDWEHVAIQLADALGDDWFANRQPARLIYAFVAAPGCDIAETLQRLARQRQLGVLTAPPRESLSEASQSNTSAFHAVDDLSCEILVVPHLERWYLRHEDGFVILRNLLERLISLRKRVLLGCDSWAWALLQQAIGIEDMLGEPQALAPFDATRLDAWFRSTIDLEGHEFRPSGDDELIFPEVPNAEVPSKLESSQFIASLAAKARGNPSVAVAFWRSCLRTRDTDTDALAPPAGGAKSDFWLVSPTDLALPELPVDVDRVHRFVLHSVLVHGGLSLSLLGTVLPFSRNDIQRRVSALRRAGVLEERDDTLRVTLTAYPLVRRDLQSEGFLTDAF